ncbi:MAG: transposase [Candidatus Levybacteria bacterium]|nr:transposase [Candidatus Levybacteria bacterium]
MPIKNTIKTYIENGYYHIYNRGVDKREIFLAEQDCIVFLYYLKLYLSSPEVLMKDPFLTPRMLFKITNLNLSKEVNLLSFTLMPNHFHLHVKQYIPDGIEKLTRRVLTAYAQHFNKKYKRVGTLFESTYKAVLVDTDEQNLYLSSYIHRNPMRLSNPKFDFIQFSSYPYYLSHMNANWLKTEEVLSYFRTSRSTSKNDLLSYQNFVESFKEKPESMLGGITLENEDDY